MRTTDELRPGFERMDADVYATARRLGVEISVRTGDDRTIDRFAFLEVYWHPAFFIVTMSSRDGVFPSRRHSGRPVPD